MTRKQFLSIFVAVLFGFGAGYATSFTIQRQEARGLILAHELGVVAYAANTLNSLPDRPETASKVQLLALESSLQRLGELSLQMQRLPIPTPSLQEGLNRAARYGESHGRPDIVERAGQVKKRLFGGA